MPAPIPPRRLTPAALGAAGAAAAFLGAGLWHIGAQRTPPTFDDAWYLETSFRFHHALTGEGLLAFARAYAGAFRFKAPLLSVLPLPFYLAAGPSIGAALAAVLACAPLLGAYLYLYGRRLGGERAGLAAVLAAFTMPMLLGLSRRFLVEFPLAALVAACAYHLEASEGLSKKGHVRMVGVLLGLGLLMKSLFPFYLLVPATWAAYQGRRRPLEGPLKTILWIAAPIALTWYGPNLVYVLGYMARASFGDIAAHYGSTRVFSPSVIGRYWLTAADDGTSPYYLLAALLLVRKPSRPVLGWLLLPLAVSTFGVNKDIRFLTPCLPALALLLGQALGRWKTPALAAFFAFPLLQAGVQTFGPENTSLGLAGLDLLKARGSYMGPPSSEGAWGQERLVSELARAVGRGVIALGTEHSHLNANNLSCLSAKAGYPVSFVSYGYAEGRVERVVARLREKDVDWLLLVDGLPEAELPDTVRGVEPKLRALLESGRLPFAFVREFRLENGVRLRLHRRTAPILIHGEP